MLETPHIIVGAAIALKFGNPALAIPLAFGSHFILEKVPHWNPHLNTEKKKYGELSMQTKKIIAIDVVSSIFIGFFLASRALPDTKHVFVVLASCFFAALPDLIEAPYYLFNIRNKFIEKSWVPFKKSLQVDTSIIPGLITQLLVVVAAFWWILV